jgi:hypothetical protein
MMQKEQRLLLQIGVMARRQLDALRGQEIEFRIMRRRHRLVHRGDHALIGLRPGDREHLGKALADRLGFSPHAARHDDLAVLGERGADRLERFGLGAVEEAASVDDDAIGPLMAMRQRIAFGAKLRDDALGIDERLRAAERDETDGRG